MTYSRIIPIEFNHCDPAGIVFYPRYFEMTNSVMENFFADVLGHSYAQITVQDGCSVPTVRIEVDFRAPSRLGDRVEFRLTILRVGSSSFRARITAHGGDELRLTAELTLVWVNNAGRAAPWPGALRDRLLAQLEGETP